MKGTATGRLRNDASPTAHLFLEVVLPVDKVGMADAAGDDQRLIRVRHCRRCVCRAEKAREEWGARRKREGVILEPVGDVGVGWGGAVERG